MVRVFSLKDSVFLDSFRKSVSFFEDGRFEIGP